MSCDKNDCKPNAVALNLKSYVRAGQVCHENGTLSQLDVSPLGLVCHFPYGGLSTFTSLNTLTVGQIALPYDQVGASSSPSKGLLAGKSQSCEPGTPASKCGLRKPIPDK